METSRREEKYNFGRLVDTASLAPAVVEKHGWPVVIVRPVKEYERLKAIELKKAVA
jgi:PHD/YefM family antitoxin component YafN of YafNO toxin-antitoxin module